MTFRPAGFRSYLLPASLAVVAAVCGCSTTSKVWTLPVESDRLSRIEPLLHSFEPSENYFWTNRRGELCVVVSVPVKGGLAPNDRERFDLSLVLGPIPADVGRMYRATQYTLRAAIQQGILPSRYASTRGVVRVEYGQDRDRLHVRFRVWTNEQIFKIWTGWRSTGEVLFVGDVVAARNAEAGERLLSRTETEGMERIRPGVPVRVFGPPVSRE